MDGKEVVDIFYFESLSFMDVELFLSWSIKENTSVIYLSLFKQRHLQVDKLSTF